MPLPKMTLCRQAFPRDTIATPAETLTSLIRSSWIPETVQPGQTVAITGGSRGIAAIVPLIQALVAALQGLGPYPSSSTRWGATAAPRWKGRKNF